MLHAVRHKNVYNTWSSVELGIELGKVCFFTVVHFVTYNPTVTICSDPTVHSHLGITDT